jgi:predicted permease
MPFVEQGADIHSLHQGSFRAAKYTSLLLLSIFTADILPIFILAAIGFLLARFSAVDARSLSRVTFNALSPCLVFHLLVTSTISGVDFGRMALFCVLVMASMGILARLAAVPLGLDRPTTIALMLVVMFSNGGNYGLPVALFAFGGQALAFASVYFVSSSLLTYTGGVFLAASGRRSVVQALWGITRVPTIYAVCAAALVLWFRVPLPEAVLRPVTLLSDAALPLMILVLGMQLERANRPERFSVVATAVVMSLLVTPILGWTLGRLLGLVGAAFQAGVIQASMPAAVVTTILALQYEVAPNLVTSVVIISSLLSPFTLTWIIAALK